MAKQKKGLNADEIRAMREEERIGSALPQEKFSWKWVNNVVVLLVALFAAGLLLTGLFYLNRLTSFMNAYALPYLWMVDDSSGFLPECLHCVIRLLLAALAIILFGFALDINFSAAGRVKEVWGKRVRYCVLAALGSDVIFLLLSRFLGQPPTPVTGSLFSVIMYYFTKLAAVPLTNVMVYLVIPSAVVKMFLLLASSSPVKLEWPRIVITTVTLTLGMLGMTWGDITAASPQVILYAVIQSAACSVVYHRTDTVWRPTLLYMGVTALYYGLNALFSFFG